MFKFKFNVAFTSTNANYTFKFNVASTSTKANYMFKFNFNVAFTSTEACSSSMLFCVQRDHKDYEERGAQDGHLDFHTAPEL